MNDRELKALIRASVERHLGLKAHGSGFTGLRDTGIPEPNSSAATHPGALAPQHISAAVYLSILNPGDSCVIEPNVTCNHCGHCKCHGY